ncbi:MAG: glycosyltransferase family 4 protein [Cyanobium sp.]|jgi:glycosyltransferase involved in cell wall biosynthesis
MEQASLRLMEALQLRGHDLSVVSLHALGSLTPALQARGISARGLGYGQLPLWLLIWRLRRQLRIQGPDALLLTGHSLPVLLAIAGSRPIPRVLAIHFHHTGVKPSWFWRLYYGVAMHLVSAVTFPSDFVRREALQLCPALAAKAHTLRNPISAVVPPTPAERLAARQRFGLPSGAPVIGNAGWLIARKRFDVFLRTATAVLQERPDVRFLIAGDGPERQQLQAMASSLGIQHALVWAGWLEEMRPLYAALDVLLFHSDWDALGMTPIEAIVHGVPVVSSVLHGGLAEVLRPGVDAVVLDQHDVGRLAQATLELLANPTGAAAMVNQAGDHVLAMCDPDALAAWHERAFTREARR